MEVLEEKGEVAHLAADTRYQRARAVVNSNKFFYLMTSAASITLIGSRVAFRQEFMASHFTLSQLQSQRCAVDGVHVETLQFQ